MTTDPGWARLLAAARRAWERTGGRLDTRISLTDPNDAERRVVIGLTGRHRSPDTARLTVTLAELDAGLRRARGMTLEDVLSGAGPLRDRPAERAAEAAERAGAAEALRSNIHGDAEWFSAWRAALAADGTLTRLVRRGEARLAELAVAVLERLPADGLPLPALAEAVSGGDPKALGDGPLAHLVLRALALRAGLDPPANAEQRRALWDGAGVVVDDLASQVLVLNLPAGGEGLGSWLTDAAARGVPLRVTLHQLTALPIARRVEQVFVCENPAVLRAATRLGAGAAPLICTEGVPSAACWRLLTQLGATAGRLDVRWRNDFDWAGLRITGAATSRVSATPWRMGEDDYRAALTLGDSEPLRGTPALSPWDSGLATALAAVGRSVMEERLIPQLLDDLRDLP